MLMCMAASKQTDPKVSHFLFLPYAIHTITALFIDMQNHKKKKPSALLHIKTPGPYVHLLDLSHGLRLRLRHQLYIIL